MDRQLPTVETAQKLGLLEEEFEKIKQILGRTPNFTELSIFSVMWSEHCSYKNSIVRLKTLPKDSPRMLAKAGEESAMPKELGFDIETDKKFRKDAFLFGEAQGRIVVSVSPEQQAAF